MVCGRQNINFEKFKPVMLAALRSLKLVSEFEVSVVFFDLISKPQQHGSFSPAELPLLEQRFCQESVEIVCPGHRPPCRWQRLHKHWRWRGLFWPTAVLGSSWGHVRLLGPCCCCGAMLRSMFKKGAPNFGSWGGGPFFLFGSFWGRGAWPWARHMVARLTYTMGLEGASDMSCCRPFEKGPKDTTL